MYCSALDFRSTEFIANKTIHACKVWILFQEITGIVPSQLEILFPFNALSGLISNVTIHNGEYLSQQSHCLAVDSLCSSALTLSFLHFTF